MNAQVRFAAIAAVLSLTQLGCPTDEEDDSDAAVDVVDEATPDAVDDTESSDVAEDAAAEAMNHWFIDAEERPALYASLNCELFGTALRLSATDTGGMGTIQILLPAVPTADGAYTVTAVSDPSMLGASGVYMSIGRDRDGDAQFVGQSGTVDVTVGTAPRSIRLEFADVAGLTRAGGTAVLSGDVRAAEGDFVGACDFDELVP